MGNPRENVRLVMPGSNAELLLTFPGFGAVEVPKADDARYFASLYSNYADDGLKRLAVAYV